MPLTQIFGNLSLWASLPAFVLYYLFYSSFERDNPEGRVTDTKVNLFVHSITSSSKLKLTYNLQPINSF